LRGGCPLGRFARPKEVADYLDSTAESVLHGAALQAVCRF